MTETFIHLADMCVLYYFYISCGSSVYLQCDLIKKKKGYKIIIIMTCKVQLWGWGTARARA